MKIFKVDDQEKLIQYSEQDFKKDNFEELLESWLENNPHILLEDEKILVIGRQVVTNLGSVIDLLAVGKNGDLIVIELKRDRTPRDTVAQILEYTSFVEELSYDKLEEIFLKYTSEDNINLADYHRNYFQLQEDEAVAFNKNQKPMIIAQVITKEIKQTANYLRKKGIDFYCLEFKYFTDQDAGRLIATDFVVGRDLASVQTVSSGSLPKINRQAFLDSLDENGKTVFSEILSFSDHNNLPIHWGSKGFSLNVDLGGNHINVIYGYPPHAVFKQSIYTVGGDIIKKVDNGEEIADYFYEKLKELGGFEPAGSGLKLMINRPLTSEEVKGIIEIISEIVEMIRENGLKE